MTETPSQPVTPNGWGVACWLCGHPATYHGMTFCQVRAGASNKRACDCTGYTASAPVPANPPQPTAENRALHAGGDMSDQPPVWQVWKYQLNAGITHLQMPMDAKVVHVDVQYGQPQLWALVRPANEIRDRDFFVVGTGHQFEEYLEPAHVGTFMLDGGARVFHVFESMDARIEHAMDRIRP